MAAAGGPAGTSRSRGCSQDTVAAPPYPADRDRPSRTWSPSRPCNSSSSVVRSGSLPAQQLGRPLGEFVHPGATRSAVTPAVSVRLHHQRDRTAGRPYTRTDGTARGAVFAYESLDAGQQFGGVLLLRAGSEPDLTTLEEELHGLLGDQVRLGRSRSAGYGGAAPGSWGQPREREVPAGPPAAAIPAAVS